LGESLSLFGPIIWFIEQLLWLFIVVLLIRVVLSWLFALDVVHPRQPAAFQINDFVTRLTDPVLRPIQRIIPPIGGIDLSVLILMLLVYVVLMYLGQLRFVLP
jgi:YggT family protein